MKYVTLIVAAGLILTVTATAGAVTFNFDPNDLLDLYPASAGMSDVPGENKATQNNPRRLRKLSSYSPDGTTVDTFWNQTGLPDKNEQPKEYNTYRNWQASLGEYEGIASFNIWLANNWAVRSWGETLVTKPGSSVTATADTANGWNAEIVGNPWVDDYVIARWYTDDSTKYLRPGGANIGEFSFTADSYIDDDQNGWDDDDPAAVLGDNYRIWFGSQNGQESDRSTGAIFFDGTWGSSFGPPAYGAFAAVNDYPNVGSSWEGVLELTAVPEPMTMLAVGMGIAGLAGYIRKRKLA